MPMCVIFSPLLLDVFPEAALFCRAVCLQQLGQAFDGPANYFAIAKLGDCSWCSAGEEYSGASVERSSFAVTS